jgi:hypothetical protein
VHDFPHAVVDALAVRKLTGRTAAVNATTTAADTLADLDILTFPSGSIQAMRAPRASHGRAAGSELALGLSMKRRRRTLIAAR